MKERKNILFGTIKVKGKILKDAVWTEGEQYKNQEIEEVIKSKIVGRTSITKSYTEVNASEEKRNNITGAYE